MTDKGVDFMYNIIAIERQYASGSNEIGRKLAKALGYKLYDRNILAEAAKNLGISHIYIETWKRPGPEVQFQSFKNLHR